MAEQKQESKKIEFKIEKDKIDKLKESFGDIEELSDMDDNYDLDALKELKKMSNENFIAKGRLFFRCYNILIEKVEYLKSYKEAHEFVSSIELTKEFEYNVEYYNTGKFGSVVKGERIKRYVLENTKEINTLIDLFFKLFGEE